LALRELLRCLPLSSQVAQFSEKPAAAGFFVGALRSTARRFTGADALMPFKTLQQMYVVSVLP
jgi:hypothetical protein